MSLTHCNDWRFTHFNLMESDFLLYNFVEINTVIKCFFRKLFLSILVMIKRLVEKPHRTRRLYTVVWVFAVESLGPGCFYTASKTVILIWRLRQMFLYWKHWSSSKRNFSCLVTCFSQQFFFLFKSIIFVNIQEVAIDFGILLWPRILSSWNSPCLWRYSGLLSELCTARAKLPELMTYKSRSGCRNCFSWTRQTSLKGFNGFGKERWGEFKKLRYHSRYKLLLVHQ